MDQISYRQTDSQITELRAYLKTLSFDFFGTIALNFKVRDKDNLPLKLSRFHQHVDEAMLGRKFYMLPPSQRTLFFAFYEHPDTNLHLHLMIKVPLGKVSHYEGIAPRCWKRLWPPGDLLLSRLRTYADVCRAVDYSTKDLRNSNNFDSFLVSAQFIRS